MAIGVVLDMLVRLVADAHRADATVARQGIEAALDELVFETDAIDRLKVAVRSRGMHDVEQIAEVVLHRRHFRDAVERPDHEERVAQPAIAVIPRPAAARRFRNRRRHRRDDRARVFEAMQLQRERGSNDVALIARWNVAVLDPAAPMTNGLIEKVIAERRERLFDRLSPCERETLPSAEAERPAVGEEGVKAALEFLGRGQVEPFAEFEKLVLLHVIVGGRPLVVEGWSDALPKSLFSPEWLEQTYDKKRAYISIQPTRGPLVLC